MDNTGKKDKINTIEKLDFNKVKQEEKGFTTHLNLVLQHTHDAIALGVWCYLSSLPTDWAINKKHVREHFNVGRDKFDKILKILKKLNLIEFKQDKKTNGKFDDFFIVVKAGHEFVRSTENQCTGEKSKKTPKYRDNNRYTDKPVTGLPVTGNQHLQKKEIQKKDFDTNKTKSSLDKKAANQKQHDFASSMNQMANEQKSISANEEYKRAPTPDFIKDLLGIKKDKVKGMV